MSEIRFTVENKQYIYVSYYADDGRFRMPTGAKGTRLQLKQNTLDKNNQRRVDRLKYLLTDHIDKCKLVEAPVYKANLKAIVNAGQPKRRSTSETVVDLFKRYCEKIVSGEILSKGSARYSESTIHVLGVVENKYLGLPVFEGRRMDDITMKDFIVLKNAMLKEMLSQNSIKLYIALIRIFFKRTHKMGWHTNKVYEHEELNIGEEIPDTAVYLNTDELLLLLQAETNEAQERQRDIFVFGCYLGLRYSDLSTLTTDNIKNGMLYVNTKKKGNTVNIPLHPMALQIWNKYEGKLPFTKDAPFKVSIRNIAEKIEMNEQCLRIRTKGGIKTKEYLPKYKLIGTHTMRRSFATNAFKAGVPTISIMMITGHKTESSFMRYIRISNEENALLMAEHPFFKG